MRVQRTSRGRRNDQARPVILDELSHIGDISVEGASSVVRCEEIGMAMVSEGGTKNVVTSGRPVKEWKLYS